jgi:hypothetical protein
VPSPGDSVIAGDQQFGGDHKRIADADSKLHVQLASERQVEERSV